MSIKKRPLVILTGPTAVGKTALSIALAKRIGGEIISADSMQVYRHMDIGSAKITKEEMDGVPHYLIDELEPSEEFHIVKFKEMAEAALQKIYENGHIPIVVGGTGFYIQGLLYDIDFEDTNEDAAFRDEMLNYAKEHGNHALHEKLRLVDEKAAGEIHENNVKRVIRALEYYHLTGNQISAHNELERAKESPYQFCYFVLNDHRKTLYERIDQRVDVMFEKGLIEEVRHLKELGYRKSDVSMQGIGYKELFDYLEQTVTLKDTIDLIKKSTRHFAKRQITWFKREKDVIWLDKFVYGYDDQQILDEMIHRLKEKEIV